MSLENPKIDIGIDTLKIINTDLKNEWPNLFDILLAKEYKLDVSVESISIQIKINIIIWKDFPNIFEIYTNGVEYIPIKNGNISGGSVSKNKSFISLFALNPRDCAEIVISPIDYTKYSKLIFVIFNVQKYISFL